MFMAHLDKQNNKKITFQYLPVWRKKKNKKKLKNI